MNFNVDYNGEKIARLEFELTNVGNGIRVLEERGINPDLVKDLYNQAAEKLYEIRHLREQVKGEIKSPDQKLIVGCLTVYPEVMMRGEEKTLEYLSDKFPHMKVRKTRKSLHYLIKINCLPIDTKSNQVEP